MKNLLELLLIPMIISASSLATSASGFTDVEPGEPHYVAITYLQEQGIIEGYSDNTYKPYQQVTRAEALKILTLTSSVYTEEDQPELENDEDKPFPDTPISAWYTKYAAAAKNNGIIKGYDDGTFQPGKNINLAETLKIHLESIQRVTVKPSPEDELFADTPLDAWFTPYAILAGSEGMINISGSNYIFPNHEMTRGYLAEIMYRTIMHEQGFEFGKATFYGAAVQGNYTASGEIFNMYQMTAAHKTLPFGTVVEVTNLANGKSVQVRITDRGPYGYGRIIDLTSSAFDEIAWLGTGIIDAQYEIISLP